MRFRREALQWNGSDTDAAALCARLAPGHWTIEAGHRPPPEHDPEYLPLGAGLVGALAVSLSSATMIGLNLGPALVDRLTELDSAAGPMAGLVLHELIVNAVIHGNLRVPSGRSDLWHDMMDRQDAIAAALADPVRAGRLVTVAAGWRAQEVTAVIADEGEGYDPAAILDVTRGSGRGLRLARMAGRVEVGCGGRQIAISLPSRPHAGGGQ